ncbi:hypothetical protein LPJ77_001069 [Coemansia sp. RSA 2523]|nr:hypothetical protein LPJ54_000765 [Coemansia sp. RSA 1824]KAJ1793087.1 hypothetical protein LPJ62_000448 [Coemansia sp. RSA 2167]KAJ1810219.1 hypothetical protein LPJ77_001069 [Coemansia sp. RSA 2523]KAJ2154455.1 hypothetical protein J3F82_001197 [Coemansia sp. RSA 637]KAJ2537005.1 hypothetical protein IWW43_000391 [Coemansia sp. RSA 1935]KAJ2641807.1 hypothetical protein IW137_002944 [Coemansia sp. RSA 1287]
MAHPLVAAHIILAAIAKIACLNTDKASASIPTTMADKLQQQLDEAERMYNDELKDIHAQHKRKCATLAKGYNGIMALYQRECWVADEFARQAAPIKCDIGTFGEEARMIVEDRDAKAEEVKYLQALLAACAV